MVPSGCSWRVLPEGVRVKDFRNTRKRRFVRYFLWLPVHKSWQLQAVLQISFHFLTKSLTIVSEFAHFFRIAFFKSFTEKIDVCIVHSRFNYSLHIFSNLVSRHFVYGQNTINLECERNNLPSSNVWKLRHLYHLGVRSDKARTPCL